MIGKPKLRTEARARRAKLAAAMPDFALRLANHAHALGLAAGTPVGAYAALPGEVDPKYLIVALEALGCIIAFPRVVGVGLPLSFHRVPAGQPMAKGEFGVHEPSPDWPAVRPSAILVPLLAFDAKGYRLGYGGGYYDRTLVILKSSHPVRGIGIAYAGQEMVSLPHDAHDQPLDMIITEEGIRRFK